MANPALQSITNTIAGILYSGQLSTTAPVVVYTVPGNTTTKVAQGTVCNTSAAVVNVSVALLKSGDSVDGTHQIVSLYPLAAGDTLALKDYLGGAMLGEGQSIAVTAGTANGIDVVITGAESS